MLYIFVDFYLLGIVLFLIEFWKILVRIGVILVVCFFRNYGGMVLGLEVLFVFNSDNCFVILFVVIDRLLMVGILLYLILGMFDKFF